MTLRREAERMDHPLGRFPVSRDVGQADLLTLDDGSLERIEVGW